MHAYVVHDTHELLHRTGAHPRAPEATRTRTDGVKSFASVVCGARNLRLECRERPRARNNMWLCTQQREFHHVPLAPRANLLRSRRQRKSY